MWSEGPSGLMQGVTVRIRPPKDFRKGEENEKLESAVSAEMPAPTPSPIPSAAPKEGLLVLSWALEPVRGDWEGVVVEVDVEVAAACASTAIAGEEARTNNESSAPIQLMIPIIY